MLTFGGEKEVRESCISRSRTGRYSDKNKGRKCKQGQIPWGIGFWEQGFHRVQGNQQKQRRQEQTVKPPSHKMAT